MDTTGFFEDLLYLLQHIYVGPDFAARRWTRIECHDYQVPLGLIAGVLADFDLPGVSDGAILRDTPEYRAVADIVENSRLSVLLEVDSDGQRVRYRQEIPTSLKKDVAGFIARNTSGCSDWIH